MTDELRVILEVGKSRRVVAGATDWPGLDRWGTSEDSSIEKLLSYVPRYAAVAERADRAAEFARARDVEVVERVPGSSSTDFWGIAHVPSQIEAEILPPDELERRLDVLQACWAWFDDVTARITGELLPGARGGGRTREQIIRHVYANEPEQMTRKVEVRTEREVVLTPDGLARHRKADARRDPRLQRRGQAGADLADPVPDPADRPPRDGPRLGDGGPRPRPEPRRMTTRPATSAGGTGTGSPRSM